MKNTFRKRGQGQKTASKDSNGGQSEVHQVHANHREKSSLFSERLLVIMARRSHYNHIGSL